MYYSTTLQNLFTFDDLLQSLEDRFREMSKSQLYELDMTNYG